MTGSNHLKAQSRFRFPRILPTFKILVPLFGLIGFGAIAHAEAVTDTATMEQAVGGPHEGGQVERADPQFRSLFLSWKRLDQVQYGAIAVPSAKPIKANVNFTSGYGVRSDPFRGGAAMHAGIDLAGPIGTPIYATADGMVDRAEWANGYGNLVQISHGRGIQTRYGHLSQMLVRPGQRVRRGDLIAKMGSTGRSTGSHLHYEVRLDGHAVNPAPFLQSADYVVAMRTRLANEKLALGGPDN